MASSAIIAVAPVVAVTVLEDRASVTRRGVVPIGAGQHRIAIERVAPVLADKTLIATATGGRVLDVRCERYVAPWRAVETGGAATAASDTAAALHAERVRLERVEAIAAGQVDAAHAEIAAVHELLVAALRELAITASRGITVTDADAQLAELDASSAGARVRLVDAEHAFATDRAELARLITRLARAEHDAGDEAARLILDVVAEQPGELVVTITYIVGGAAWRPYHRAALDRDAGRIAWDTTACVWQATGEDWTDAALTFSLERPSLGTEPPTLADDELAARKKPDTIVVEAREQELHTTGLGGGAARGPAEVPGIDDGGLGLRLVGAHPVTVRATGFPHRVAIARFEAPAQISLVAIPLRSPWVHVRARLTNFSPAQAPLLAGPVDLIMASGYVGRAEVGFIAGGETFELGFGPESDLRVHRDEIRTRDDAGLLGGWNVQTVRVAVRVSNLSTTRRELLITERVPISEVEQVEIQVAAEDAYLLAADDLVGGEAVTQITARKLDDRGQVTWTVELPPLARRAVALEYRVRSQRGVAGV